MEVFVPGILEPLRDTRMCLESKRSVACVNQEARRIFTELLRQHNVSVDWEDCTLSNARFVLQSGVQIAPVGERMIPLLSKRFKKLHIRLRDEGIGVQMQLSTAFFLGHILALKPAIIRLTTGRQKCLTSLRTNPRVFLADSLSLADRLVLAPSLHENALQRIRWGHDNLILAELNLYDESLARLLPQLNLNLKSLDLSRNKFGAPGLRALPPMINLNTLCLSGTPIPALPADLFYGIPQLANLLLSNVQLNNEGLEALNFHQLKNLACLDLSCNPFNTGIHSLLRPERLPLRKLNFLNLIQCNRVSTASFKTLARAVRDYAFPAMQDLCVNKKPALVALRAALGWLEADRKWTNALKSNTELRNWAHASLLPPSPGSRSPPRSPTH